MFFNKFKKIIKSYRIDDNELAFLKLKKPVKINKQEIGVIECVKDYKFMNRLSSLLNSINEDNLELVGIWPYINMSGTLPKNNIFIFIRSFLENYLLFKKWSNIYSVLGVQDPIKIGSINIFYKFKYFYRSIKIFKFLSRKKNLHDLTIDSTKVGDLIYASYIRFREKEDVDYEDKFLIFLIFNVIVIQNQIKNLVKKRKISFYIANYSSYVQHGVAVREFLKHGVSVYSMGNIRPIAKLHYGDDFTHRLRYWDYPSLLKTLPNLSELQAKASKEFIARFSGSIDGGLSYMKKSAYSPTPRKENSKFDGVVYLHDFFDSAFDHRKYLFNSLYEWAFHTLLLIRTHRLNIAIKPHPNAIREGDKVVELLKNQFPDLNWIDPQESNLNLISNSKASISVFGSILYEAAYHEKVAIAAGEHPASWFDLCHQPKSQSDYDQMLINIDSLVPVEASRVKAINFYICNNYLVDERDIDLKINEEGIDWESSMSLESLAKNIQLSSGESGA